MSPDSGQTCPVARLDDAVIGLGLRSGWCRFEAVPRQGDEVGGEHRCPGVRSEGSQPPPGASGQPEAPLQEGDARLDAGAESDEALVHPVAARHVRDLHAAPLGKDDIADAKVFDGREVRLGRKAAVKDRLSGLSSEAHRVPLDHLDRQGRVRRVSFVDDTVGDDPTGPTSHSDLVTKLGLAPSLDDDVRVGFKDGDELLRGGDLFAVDNPPVGLVDDFPGEGDVVTQLLFESLREQTFERAEPLEFTEGIGDSRGVVDGDPGRLQELPIQLLPLERLGRPELVSGLLGDPSVVGADDPKRHLAALNVAGQDPDRVPELIRVPGLVYIGLDDGAVDADLAPLLDSRQPSLGEDDLMDPLKGLSPDLLDVLVEAGPLGGLVEGADAAEPAVAPGICQMEGQLLVAEAVHLLDEERPQGLLRGHTGAAGLPVDTRRDDVVPDPTKDLGVPVENLADLVEFGRVAVLDRSGGQRPVLWYSSHGYPSRVLCVFVMQSGMLSCRRTKREAYLSAESGVISRSRNAGWTSVHADLSFMDGH
jgi:hypothetical protein